MIFLHGSCRGAQQKIASHDFLLLVVTIGHGSNVGFMKKKIRTRVLSGASPVKAEAGTAASKPEAAATCTIQSVCEGIRWYGVEAF